MEDISRRPYRFQENDQYPNQQDFDDIVQNYLDNLSFKKRDKALIDRQRYELILQVLREPKNTSVSTAQFRFWVKKMFQLVPFHGERLVVCHDNKPVAIREQIYNILIWAHRQSHHGGRDKTSTLVRRRFSWIPKELIARFVRHCPFCITRRNGHVDMFSTYAMQPNHNPPYTFDSLHRESQLTMYQSSSPPTHPSHLSTEDTAIFYPLPSSSVSSASSASSSTYSALTTSSSSTSSTASPGLYCCYSSQQQQRPSPEMVFKKEASPSALVGLASPEVSPMDYYAHPRQPPQPALESYDFMPQQQRHALLTSPTSPLSPIADYDSKQTISFVNQPSLNLMSFF